MQRLMRGCLGSRWSARCGLAGNGRRHCGRMRSAGDHGDAGPCPASSGPVRRHGSRHVVIATLGRTILRRRARRQTAAFHRRPETGVGGGYVCLRAAARGMTRRTRSLSSPSRRAVKHGRRAAAGLPVGPRVPCPRTAGSVVSGLTACGAKSSAESGGRRPPDPATPGVPGANPRRHAESGQRPSTASPVSRAAPCPVPSGALGGQFVMLTFEHLVHLITCPKEFLRRAVQEAVGRAAVRLPRKDRAVLGTAVRDRSSPRPPRRLPAAASAAQRSTTSATARTAWGRRTNGWPGRSRRCRDRRSSSLNAAARTCRIASAPAGWFQNISVPFTR